MLEYKIENLLKRAIQYPAGSAIYSLIQDSKVVYVGQTSNQHLEITTI